jgi:hypothetical protein
MQQCLSNAFGISQLRIPVSLSFSLSLSLAILTFDFTFVVTIPKSLFKKGSDIVSYPLQLLVAFSLCSLETTSYMSPDKRHGYGVGPRSMAASGV